MERVYSVIESPTLYMGFSFWENVKIRGHPGPTEMNSSDGHLLSQLFTKELLRTKPRHLRFDPRPKISPLTKWSPGSFSG